MTIGERVRVIRQRRGLSQNALSRRSGVRQATISAIEAGKRKEVSSTILRQLAEALGVTTDFLVGMYCAEGDGSPDLMPGGGPSLDGVAPLPVAVAR